MPPALAVCHICGREFGTASIDIHIPQCARKWEAAEAQKPPRDRRPVPERPELPPGTSRESANEAVRQHWNEEVLEACPHCGRTFLPDRLEVHLRSCRPPTSARPSSRGGLRRTTADNPQTAPPPPPPPQKHKRAARKTTSNPPSLVVCHICGREFGSASIDIHLPQCAKKWEAAEAQKPASQRRPVPQRPELGDGLTRDQANDKLMEHWNTEVLSPCPHCSRTFLPDRLEVHLRSCKPKGGQRTSRAGYEAPANSPVPRLFRPRPKSAPSVRPKAVVCHICGREFGTASIAIHIPQCERKWEAAEEQKPSHLRKPIPQKPELAAGLSQEEANEVLLKNWNDEVLEACPHCERTFLPDRLAVHLRSCRASTPAKSRTRSCGAPKQETPEKSPGLSSPSTTASPRPGTTSSPDLPKSPALSKTLPSRPHLVVCHICGREFGSASIAIHIPQCERKWEAAQASKPADERRPVPQKPDLDGLGRQEAKEKTLKNWNDSVLEPCPHCKRTFLPDRLEVHLRGCRPRTPVPQRPPAAAWSLPEEASCRVTESKPERQVTKAVCYARPRTVVCYICGREFGTASIDIHVPQCEQKWEMAEAKKPEADRRPVPQRPALDDKLMQHWNEQVLEPCPHCGRTFLPDRLHVHLRSCRPKESAH